MSTWTVRDIDYVGGFEYPYSITGTAYLFRTEREARECLKRLSDWERGKGPCPTPEEYR